MPYEIVLNGRFDSALLRRLLRKDTLLLLMESCADLDVCPLLRSDDLADTHGEGGNG
jgi:hypothetical protein